MHRSSILLILLMPCVLIACGHKESVTIPPVSNAGIEVQIALRHTPYRSGDATDSGHFDQVASVVVPLPLNDGAGDAVAISNGFWVEMRWSRVESLTGEPGVLLDGFRWRIRNQLVDQPTGATWKYDWSGTTDGGSTSFRNEFAALVTPISLGHTATTAKTARMLVIRARWVDKLPPAHDVILRQQQNQ